jgi:hypothetical protein
MMSENGNAPAAGMTKREAFAALAMHQIMHGAVLPTAENRAYYLPLAAAAACEVADALLAALEVTP